MLTEIELQSLEYAARNGFQASPWQLQAIWDLIAEVRMRRAESGDPVELREFTAPQDEPEPTPYSDGNVPCPRCAGTGQITEHAEPMTWWTGPAIWTRPCPACAGKLDGYTVLYIDCLLPDGMDECMSLIKQSLQKAATVYVRRVVAANQQGSAYDPR